MSIPRRPYKGGVKLSVIGFGGIVVCGMEQKDANAIVAEAVDRGVNYFDVAPSYFKGEAEEKLGAALEPYRSQVFLACKTTGTPSTRRLGSNPVRYDARVAQEELEQSLKRLRTDHFDLYQFHGITKMEDVDAIFKPGGAAETFVKAREQGRTRFIGFSAHSVQAAVAMMDRFPFDSVLFPINFVCYAQGNFGPQVVQKAKEKGVARLALKAFAHTPWPEGAEKKYRKCWYQPVDDPALARQ
ncbi:MAG: aldo/keto reductase, partial [Planctomycetes bacterium]|nr:aldo/keto reductase [Planctomycetota bacterium]